MQPESTHRGPHEAEAPRAVGAASAASGPRLVARRAGGGEAVTVVMACRNGRPYLHAALESLRAQTHEAWSLVFVDAGSDDGSADLVSALIPDARVLRMEGVATPGAARNAGVRLARTPFLAFLDADDRALPGRLAEQVALARSSGAPLVYGDCAVVDGEGRRLGGYFSRCTPRRGSVFSHLLRENFVPLSSILVDRAFFEASGGFRDDLLVAGDYAWLLRAARMAPFDFVDHPVVEYRVRPGALSADFRRAYGENLRVLKELGEDLGSVDGEPADIDFARSLVAWRWSLREALVGPAAWPAAASLALAAVRAAGSSGRAVRGAAATLRQALRGLPLRLRMRRARRDGGTVGRTGTGRRPAAGPVASRRS